MIRGVLRMVRAVALSAFATTKSHTWFPRGSGARERGVENTPAVAVHMQESHR